MKRKESREAKTQTSKESKESEEADQKGKEEKQKVPVDKDHCLLLILKWGGELTTMGKEQALQLGRAFRYMQSLITGSFVFFPDEYRIGMNRAQWSNQEAWGNSHLKVTG